MVILSGFEFLTFGGVFLGVKNNSKNSGNKKNIRLFSKIWSKWTLFIRKMQKNLCFYELMDMLRMENFLICHKNQNLCISKDEYFLSKTNLREDKLIPSCLVLTCPCLSCFFIITSFLQSLFL